MRIRLSPGGHQAADLVDFGPAEGIETDFDPIAISDDLLQES
jgi:hypothetical protein